MWPCLTFVDARLARGRIPRETPWATRPTAQELYHLGHRGTCRQPVDASATLSIDYRASTLAPSGIVLLIGTNDLELGGTPEIAGSNLRSILAAIEQHEAKTPVILCEVMPSSAFMNRPASAIKAMNALYRAAAAGDPRITVLDTWTLFADADGDAPAAFFPDLLHPNADGYAKWAAALRPILARLRLTGTTGARGTP